MTSKIFSAGLFGMNSYTVTVEADVSRGLPRFDVVGLPDAAVKESRDRVTSAVKNCGYDFPVGKITINLAPADVKKAGTIYDLALFISLLKASGQLAKSLDNCCFLGELSLLGDIRPITGALPMVIHAKEAGFKAVFLPAQNAREASVVGGIDIYAVENVVDIVDFIAGTKKLSPIKPAPFFEEESLFIPDFSEVKGQRAAKRALEIACAGGHNALLLGPPGSGKSMLAKRIPAILPKMTFEEAIETTKIHSIAGLLSENRPLITTRPFRAPHHTISPAGLSGGGSVPKPGEISLAHNGVLFLDELPEFSRAAMEILRQPIEDGEVTISRVSGTLTYPCSVMLIAAMNPCPCGYFGHPTRPCTCGSKKVAAYLARVSGPLLDRLDLHIEAMPVEFDHLTDSTPAESSADILKRVEAARKLQAERYKDMGITCNARLTPAMIQKNCAVSDKGVAILKSAFERLGLSARAYDRILKVCRTIADLDGKEVIDGAHVAEAITYRSLDRKYWLTNQ